MRLEGETAVVTGGTRGIGAAITEKLAGLGVRVAAIHLRNRTAAEVTAERVRASGGEIHLFRADVGDDEAVARVMAEIGEKFGSLDILVSNAALGVIRPALDLDARAWNWTMEKNAGAFLRLVQAAVPLMRDRGGRIIAVTSWGATRILPHYAAVGAAKAAMEALARHLVPEVALFGITVNLVCPGVVETDALQAFPDCEEMVRRARERTPGGTLVSPADVAGVVALLCQPEAGRIQGQTVVVDGGAGIAG